MVDSAGAGFGCAWLASAGRRPLKRHSGSVFGECDADVNAIAAPVFGRSGALAAILGLQGPSSRLEDPARLLPVLTEEAAKLTRALGG